MAVAAPSARESPAEHRTRQTTTVSDPRPSGIAHRWPGLLVETGASGAAGPAEFSRPAHYVAVNVAATDLRLSVKGAHGYRAVVMPPRSAWVLPAGDTAVHDAHAGCAYAAVSLDPAYYARVLGRARGEPAHGADAGPELRRVYALESGPLAHLVIGLAEEAARGGPGGLLFAETLALGVALELARTAGTGRAVPESARGGLGAGARRRVLELIDARLERGALAPELSVEELAREAALSPSYFRRAFAATTGVPPHQYVLRARLARARRLLDVPGARLSDVAHAAGFADQSHFTRVFRREFGVTPGAVLRAAAPARR